MYKTIKTLIFAMAINISISHLASANIYRYTADPNDSFLTGYFEFDDSSTQFPLKFADLTVSYTNFENGRIPYGSVYPNTIGNLGPSITSNNRVWFVTGFDAFAIGFYGVGLDKLYDNPQSIVIEWMAYDLKENAFAPSQNAWNNFINGGTTDGVPELSFKTTFFSQATAVPEPTALAMLSIGSIGLVLFRRRWGFGI